ncbi:RNase A-like domain-containing protein, partial [Bacillus toyonensis]
LNNILMPKNQFALADTNALNLRSFDYTTFNKAKDTFSLAENIDRSNQYSPRVFDGDLKKHEDKGGHLIEKHVEIPDEALAQRLIDDQKITGSSSFNDLEKAQKVADAVLTNPQNIRKIERWLADPYSPPTLALRYRGDEIIGRSILRTSEDVLEVTNAKIVLKKDGEGSYIRTGFPIR